MLKPPGGGCNVTHSHPSVGQASFSLETHAPVALRENGQAWMRLESLGACRSWLQQRGVKICGVEIAEGARSVEDEPFDGPTALILGNEVRLLSRLCPPSHPLLKAPVPLTNRAQGWELSRRPSATIWSSSHSTDEGPHP